MRGRLARRLLILVLLTALATAAIWILSPVKYRAIAHIQISPVIPHMVFQTEDTGLMPLYDSFVNTQAVIIRGPMVLQRVLERPEVQATKWFRDPRPSLMQRLRGDQIPRVERLRNSLTARPRHRTEITDVVMEDPIAEDARVIVQAVVEEYEKYAANQSDEGRDELYKRLVAEYKRLQMSVQMCERVCFDLQEQLGTGDPDRLLSNRAMALDEERTALETIQQDISNLQLQIEEAGGADADDIAVDTTVVTKSQPKYYTDAEWIRLDTAVENAQRAIKISPLKPSHPNWVAMAKDLEFAERLLRLREEQLDEQWLLASGLPELTSDPNSLTPEQRLEFSKTQLELLKNQEKNLIADLSKKQEEYDRLFAISQRLRRETARLEHQRGLFKAVQARKDAKDMERNSLGRIKVLAPATASFTPHKDRRMLYSGIVLVVSLILASGMVCIRR
ncbi:MAG: GumC domain-containing protein, partial [Planctomycetota bacterium]